MPSTRPQLSLNTHHDGFNSEERNFNRKTDYLYPGLEIIPWEISFQKTLSFTDAARDCSSRGMQLASVASKSEENAILHMVDNDPTTSTNIWIGFRKKGLHSLYTLIYITSHLNQPDHVIVLLRYSTC